MRSLLFVPGNREDRFEKACQAGADLVCIDLEDAVAISDKDKSRLSVLGWLKTTSHTNVSLRINPVDTAAGQEDIEQLKSSGLNLPYVLIPKTSNLQNITKLDGQLPAQCGDLFTLIESAVGLVNCEEILSHPRVKYAMFGGVDYSSDIGSTMDWDSLLYARSRLVAAAAAYGVTLFDSPHIDVRDLDDCEESTRRSRAIGIHARSAIHPAQVTRIHNALRPTNEELKQAHRVMNAYEASKGNVALLDGKLIEEPVVKMARRILAFK